MAGMPRGMREAITDSRLDKMRQDRGRKVMAERDAMERMNKTSSGGNKNDRAHRADMESDNRRDGGRKQ